MDPQISQLQRSHVRLKLSVYLLQQLQQLSVHNRTQSQVEFLQNGSQILLPRSVDHLAQTTPSIREQYLGQVISTRSRAQTELWVDNPLGGADLVHWSRYFGPLSLTYLDHDFLDRSLDRATNPTDDGYVGYYHYCNGIVFHDETELDEYILGIIGVHQVMHSDLGELVYNDQNPGSKRETMISYCSYNVFGRSDFRAKYVVHHNASGKRLKVDKSYSIIPNLLGKTLTFNPETIKGEGVPKLHWEELYVSGLLRIVAQTDLPQKQLVGLVNFRDILATKADILRAVVTLVKYLPRGGTVVPFTAYNNTSSVLNYGTSTSSSQYRNWVVMALIKIASLDNSGDAIDLAVSEIKSLGNNAWDLVILKLWKAQINENRSQEYILLLHQMVSTSKSHSPIQRSLALLEQIKFLISKRKYDKAIVIAKVCIGLLPLDFEAWYQLLLAYLLVGNYKQALDVFNNMPVITNRKGSIRNNNKGDENKSNGGQSKEAMKKEDADTFSGISQYKVNGVADFYTKTFVDSCEHDIFISEETFTSYFPKPQETRNDASIHNIWDSIFIVDPLSRHPCVGNQFYQLPLVNASVKELSVVDPQLIKVAGPSSMRSLLASASAGLPQVLILNFEQTLTWGRSYDLLTLFTALAGWDNLVKIKEERKDCEEWVERMFMVVFQDLKALMLVTNPELEAHHSALEWCMIGILGWLAKYNIKEVICALITVARASEFNFYATTQILQIYDELILSDVSESKIDVLHDNTFNMGYNRKLLLEKLDEKHRLKFLEEVEQILLPLDFVLLQLMKIVSWNVRWYQYMPSHLVIRIIQRLTVKFDIITIKSQIRAVFESNKSVENKPTKNGFSFWGGSRKKKPVFQEHKFSPSDGIVGYMEGLVDWLAGEE